MTTFIAYGFRKKAVWPRKLIFLSHFVGLFWMTGFSTGLYYGTYSHCDSTKSDVCAVNIPLIISALIIMIILDIVLGLSIVGAYWYWIAADCAEE